MVISSCSSWSTAAPAACTASDLAYRISDLRLFACVMSFSNNVYATSVRLHRIQELRCYFLAAPRGSTDRRAYVCEKGGQLRCADINVCMPCG